MANQNNQTGGHFIVNTKDDFEIKINPVTGAIEYVNVNEVKGDEPKTLPDKLKNYAKYFRKLPHDKLITLLWKRFYRKTYPCGPITIKIASAGAAIRQLLRLGCFKEDKDELLYAYNEGRKKTMENGNIMLWREAALNLRARAFLPCNSSNNYFKTFNKDCRLVADGLEKEAQDLAGEQKNTGTGTGRKDKMSKSARALAVLHDHPDWTNKQIADAIDANEKSLPRMKGFSEARKILKTGKLDYPNGTKYFDPEAKQSNLESWDNQ